MSEKMTIKHVIWDWNGTLIDDVRVCTEIINHLLKKYNLSPVSIDQYRSVFTFPIIDYYKQIGFDFTDRSYEEIAHEYIDLYKQNFKNAGLAANAKKLLEHFRSKGLSQHLLSAMEQNELTNALNAYGLDGYFTQIRGIANHYAHGKIDTGNEMLEEYPFERKHTVLIGDTLHDHEVAREMGINCILVASGHQSYERLSSTDAVVVQQLDDIMAEKLI